MWGKVVRSEYTIWIRQIRTPNPINGTEKREHTSMVGHFLEFMKPGFESQHCK